MTIRPWALLLAISHLISTKNSHAALYLIQTTESFKLADMILLEAQWKAQEECPSPPTRLCLDAATARQWLIVDDTYESVIQRMKEKPCPRIEWIAKVWSQSPSGDPLSLGVDLPVLNQPWILTYHRGMQSPRKQQHQQSSRKEALMAYVAHALGSSHPPALLPQDTQVIIRLVELVNAQGSVSYYLGQDIVSLPSDKHCPTSTVKEAFSLAWKQRPYQYSSAINPVLAEIVVDMLYDRGVRHLWDPTCGSGTFPAFAMQRGFHTVLGTDVNPLCIEGCRYNFEHAFQGDFSKEVTFLVTDSRHFDRNDSHPPVDCVVCNLPWGLNTPCHECNAEILQNIRGQVPRGTLCVIISKDLPALIGFRVLGQAMLPPKGFELPLDKQQKRRSDKHGRSDCFVTFSETV